MALPKLCLECLHEVELHRSTGCLAGLGACPCPLDLRPPEDKGIEPGSVW